MLGWQKERRTNQVYNLLSWHSNGGTHSPGVEPSVIILTAELEKCTTVDKKLYQNVPAANFDVTYGRDADFNVF